MQIASSGPLKMPMVAELDGIRAIAVFIVFLSHVGLGSVVPGGLGVTIFFFLSGYLITSLLRAEAATRGKIDFRGFYIRRTLRIFPPLYITLAFSAILVWAGLLIDRDVDPGSVLAQIFFLANYDVLWGPHAGLPGPPLWSLAVEEHFYLIFPAVFAALLMNMSGERAAKWCAIACLFPLLFRVLNIWLLDDIGMNYLFTHTRVDSILFGCCLALWQNPVLDGEKAWRPSLFHVAIAAFVVLVAAVIRNEIFGETLRYTLQGLGLFVIFSWVLHRKDRFAAFVLTNFPAQLVGRYSYTIYLVHVIMFRLLKRNVPEIHVLGAAVGAAVLSMGYSFLMYKFVEQPLARVRQRLHRNRERLPSSESDMLAPAPTVSGG